MPDKNLGKTAAQLKKEREQLQLELDSVVREETALLTASMDARAKELLTEMRQLDFSGYYKEYELENKTWWVRIARKRAAKVQGRKTG